MTAQCDRHLLNSLKATSRVAGIIVTLVGCAVLVGWKLDIQILKGILPGWATMKPNTALGFVLSGLSLNLLYYSRHREHQIAQGLAVVVTFLGLLTLSEYLFGWNLGIDELLFVEKPGAIATSHLGRMAPGTALNFTLIGFALWLSTIKPARYRLIQLLALITALASLQVLISYIYGVKPLFGLAFYSSVALHTALSFFLLSGGVLFATPSQGWMSLVVSNTAGGITARVLLPATLIVPFTLGWLEILGERAEVFDSAFGLSFQVMGNVVVFMGLIGYCAKQLYQIDIKRHKAEKALRNAYDELEVKIEQRTAELFQANQALAEEIEERKRAEAAQRASQENLQAFIDHTTAVIYLKDLQGQYLLINRQFEMIFGLTREQIIGKTDLDIFPEEVAIAFQANDQQTLETGKALSFEEMAPIADELHTYISVKFPLYDANESVYVMGGISTDITERKQVEEALCLSEERFRRALLDAPLPTILHTEDGEVLLVNHVWSQITGYSLEEIPTLAAFLEKAYGDRKEQVQADIARVLPLQHRTAMGEYTVTTHSGETRIWDFYASPMGQLLDGRRLVVAMAFDITERKQAEADLQKYKDIFLFAQHGLAISRGAVLESVNPAFAHLHGYTVEELLGKPILDLFPPEYHAQTTALIQKLDESGHLTFESYHIRKDGTVFSVFLDITVVKDKQGNPLYRIVNLLDITERKQVEEAILNLNQELQRQLAESKTLLEVIPIGIGIAEDPDCKTIRVNSAFAQALGIPPTVNASLSAPEDERPNNFKLYHNGRQMAPEELPLQYAAAHGLEVQDLEVDVVWEDGTVVTLLEFATPLFDENQQPRGSIGAFLNITERKRAESALREQANLLELAYEAILVRDADNVITFWNRGAEQLYGWMRSQAIGQVSHTLLKTVLSPSSPNLDEILRSTECWEGELTQTRSDETQIVVESRQVLVRDDLGRVKGILEVNRDITERKEAESQLQHNALHDALTGLPNRVLLMERVQAAIQRAKRKRNYHFALLFIDLDRFKYINDTLGHLVGDRLLIEVAARLQQCIRSSDTVARLGGDEFIILLDELPEEKEALKITERILEQLKVPLVIEGQQVSTSGSIGIVFNSELDQSGNELLRNADLAMYSAKEQGKSRYAIFNPTMHVRAHKLWELENNLRTAIDKKEFLLHYQPILCLTTQTLVGFEALIRWQHPDQGLISPIDFISVAEETGWIVPIGEWVLKESCRQLALWQRLYPQADRFFISVNLSNRQLELGNFISIIDNILQDTRLPAKSLKIEITETLLMKNLEAATVLLSQLKERSIGVSIDDFGTGYSSLSYLCHLPVNTLKIDRCFVAKIDDGKESLQVIQAIIGLARQLNINVIAEGIETQYHLNRLQEFGCEYGQGYFFSKPLDSQDTAQLIYSN